MTGLDLRKNVFQDAFIWQKTNVDGRRWRDRFHRAPRFRGVSGAGTSIPFPSVAPAFFGAGRPWPTVAPVSAAATAPIAAPAAVALAGRNVVFAGKVGIAVFGRRFFHPGGQKLQIK
jgi:hypothetical protein